MSKYFLSPHVHICRTDDFVVLLDLRRDKYLAVGEKMTQQLAALVQDWPLGNCGDPAIVSAPETDSRFLQRMLQQGLLTTDAQLGKSAAPRSYQVPSSSLLEADPLAEVHLGTRRVVNFLSAAATAAMSLRFRPIEAIVEAARRRKARHAIRAAFDFEAARDAALAFERLRPLVFASRDECLFHSLTMIEYMAGEGLFPTWFFGVQTGPFAAHSWVQEGDVVFNDLAEQVRAFTPILAV